MELLYLVVLTNIPSQLGSTDADTTEKITAPSPIDSGLILSKEETLRRYMSKAVKIRGVSHFVFI